MPAFAPGVLQRYARWRGLSERTAADELQRLLDAAKPQANGSYRYRNRSDGLDLSIRVLDGEIVSVGARAYRPRSGGRPSAPERKR